MTHGYHKSRLQCWKDKILHPSTEYERVTADELHRRLNTSAPSSKNNNKTTTSTSRNHLQPPKITLRPATPVNGRIPTEKVWVWDEKSWDWVDVSLNGIPEDVPVEMECGLMVVRDGGILVLVDDEGEGKEKKVCSGVASSGDSAKGFLRVPEEDW